MCKKGIFKTKKFPVGTTMVYGSLDVYEVDEHGDMIRLRSTVTDGHGCEIPRGYCPALTESRPTTQLTATK